MQAFNFSKRFYLLVVLLLNGPLLLLSQMTNSGNFEMPTSLWMPQNSIFSIEKSKSIFDLIFATNNSGFGVELKNSSSSLTGKHYLFSQTLKSIEIYGIEAIISTDFSGKIIAVTHNFISTKPNYFVEESWEGQDLWLYKNGIFEAVKYQETKEDGHHFERLVNKNNEVLFETDAKRYHLNPPDSLVSGMVFYPDPLTSSNSVYGGKYSDFNDSATTELNVESKSVFFRTIFQNDSFKLGDEYLKFTEISSPKTSSAISKLPTFNYDRHQPQFEEVNVFYHLTEFRKQIIKLGYRHWIDTLLVDCHAFDGADQSAYDPLAKPHTLEFGDGGVDDAEDPDVAIHEFTHSISYKAAPGKNLGAERKAIEEGICDYFAMSYSRSLSNNQPYSVYNWDGHNSFWKGRSTNIYGTYPSALTGDIYTNGQLFGTALAYLFDLIGRDSCDKLVLSTLPYLSAGISMKQAALILLKVDSLIFTNPHTTQIYLAFTRKNILQWPLNTRTISVQKESKSIFFTDEQTPLPPHLKCEMYTVNGKKIFETNSEQTLQNMLLMPEGVYIGIFHFKGNNSCVFKILRN